MRSAPSPCTGCPEAKHVLDRLGSERFSLGEGADAGVDGGKEGAQGLEPALDEGPLRPVRPALSQVPPEAALHDLFITPQKSGAHSEGALRGPPAPRPRPECPLTKARV